MKQNKEQWGVENVVSLRQIASNLGGIDNSQLANCARTENKMYALYKDRLIVMSKTNKY